MAGIIDMCNVHVFTAFLSDLNSELVLFDCLDNPGFKFWFQNGKLDLYTPSLKEVKLDTKNCIWETNFFLQDLISLRRIQNFKEIHLSIFSESIALGVTLVSDAPSNLAVPLPLFR